MNYKKIYSNYPNAVERTVESYDKHADSFLQKHGQFEPIEALLMLQKHTEDNSRILDAGCGLGRDTDFLIRHGYPITMGLDMSFGMLSTGQKKGGFNFPAIVGDFRFLPFPSNQFDIVWAAASLIHVPREEIIHTLLEFQRVLVNKGVTYFNLIHGHGECGEESPSGERQRGWRYFVYFEEDEIKALLEEVHWKVLEFWERPSANRNPLKGTVRDFFHVIARTP